ncbi:MAG: phosphotransferase [Candidatus Saccharimonadales bacterium]
MTDLARINNLFHEYSPTNVVLATKSNEAFANEVFDITTADNQRYFLKVLKTQHPDAIANEVIMQKRLLEAGITTPEYIEIAPSQYVGQHEAERFIISNYIPGSSPKTVSLELINSFGATLAKLHNCLDGVTIPDNDMQWLNPRKVKGDITSYGGPVRPALDNLFSYGSAIFDLHLPRAVTHGDLWLSNVFAEDDEITTVFDLETAEETARIVDIARTYTSIRFNSNYPADEVIDTLVDGYNSAAEQQLTHEELTHIKHAIVYVCAACATWHAVHGTRYRDPYILLADEIKAQNTR